MRLINVETCKLRMNINEFHELGRIWIRGAISSSDMSQLVELSSCGDQPGARIGMNRGLQRIVGCESQLGQLVRRLSPDYSPVRLVSFNKSSETNWSVPWHQDRVIAVTEKLDVPGYSNWNCKGEFWHCEPSLSLLERMVFVRVHLDVSNETNGAMELALRSHAFGRVSAQTAEQFARSCDREICFANPGDNLIANALILHRSRSAASGKQRRALRIDYANRASLARPLEWAVPKDFS